MTRLTLRNLTSADLEFADSLRAVAGWNQTQEDWRRFLDLSPNSCLLAECEGRPVATATTIVYGKELGWIGMMLVHPDFRRRGIARVLMDHCIEILRSAGVRSIKLDATPEGREVYLKFGFQDEYRLTRYKAASALAEESSTNIRAAKAEDLASIVALDQSATGTLRERLLERLIAESSQALVYQSEERITGFGILRPGTIASYLGPIVATEVSHAHQLASALAASGEVICDLPDRNEAAAPWAKNRGLVPQRTLTRMYLGENISASAPESYFAIAGPELG
jgi:GNAT superfamily N-acetyltransferase